MYDNTQGNDANSAGQSTTSIYKQEQVKQKLQDKANQVVTEQSNILIEGSKKNATQSSREDGGSSPNMQNKKSDGVDTMRKSKSVDR